MIGCTLVKSCHVNGDRPVSFAFFLSMLTSSDLSVTLHRYRSPEYGRLRGQQYDRTLVKHVNTHFLRLVSVKWGLNHVESQFSRRESTSSLKMFGNKYIACALFSSHASKSSSLAPWVIGIHYPSRISCERQVLSRFFCCKIIEASWDSWHSQRRIHL